MSVRKLAVAAAVLGLLAGPLSAKEKETGGSVTLAGEILDMSCYMAHEGSGPKHAKCAKQCALKGTPMGLKTAKGEVLLLLSDHGKEKAYDAAKQLAGGEAKVTGRKVSRSGLTALLVEAVAAK